jgi:predicted nucleic acid-binding protein
MKDDIVFADSNIWLYSLFVSPNSTKRQIATELIENYKPILSYQVIQEVCANLIKKEKADLQKLRTILQGFKDYTIVPISLDLVRQALDLIERNQVSFWDSLIISTALAGNATILYSEDMHDGLVIENRLTIRNPF